MVQQYFDAGAAVVTLADSEQGNLLNLESLAALSQALDRSLQTAEARVILLRSNGGVFCSGMDLLRFQQEADNRKHFRQALSHYTELLYAIHTAPKPVLCLLAGPVRAGGVGLVCACDVVVASPQASFELSEVLWGLIPANVLPYLLSLRLAPQKARYLVLTSKRISAAEALRLNLVDELFPEAELERGVRGIIQRLMRSSPSALAETKDFSRRLRGTGLEEARRLGRDKLLELAGRPETRAGIRAFNEGELPDWFAKFRPGKALFLRTGHDAKD